MVTEVTKVDDKGRVLIPESIREAGEIEPGVPMQIVDLGGGVLVLRKVELLSKEEILRVCREIRRDIYKRRVEPWLKGVLKKGRR